MATQPAPRLRKISISRLIGETTPEERMREKLVYRFSNGREFAVRKQTAAPTTTPAPTTTAPPPPV